MKIPLAILFAAILAAPALGQSGTAKVSGTVKLSASIASRKMRFRLYSDVGPGATRRRTTVDPAEMSNVVIYLVPIGSKGKSALGKDTVRMSQKDETFLPHVLPISRGTTVSFPNEDPFFHSVFSLSRAKEFHLSRYPQHQTRFTRFDKAGVVKVFCDIHSDMSAVILVLDDPYFTVPEPSGRYGIEGIPPGEYRLVAWHERAKPVEKTIKLAAGESLVLDIGVPITDEP